MQFTTTNAEKIFAKLRIDKSGSNHHIKGFLVYNGRRLYPPIYFSKGKKDIPVPIIEKFRKSLCLNKDQFSVLSKCSMTMHEYFEIRMNNNGNHAEHD
jgi:hypothetical protein